MGIRAPASADDMAQAPEHLPGEFPVIEALAVDDRPTALFERVCVGHQCELAGIAIPDLQVFVVQELKPLRFRRLMDQVTKYLHKYQYIRYDLLPTSAGG
jgi:hypothetical protein